MRLAIAIPGSRHGHRASACPSDLKGRFLEATAPPYARTLPALAADLATTRSQLDRLMAITRGREPREGETRRWDALDMRRIDLEAAFRANFVLVTGLDWETAVGVMA
jgi:hypothetical protein